MSGTTRLIRLYKNRRLYDCAEHAYITFERLIQFLEAGIEFRIDDLRTGRDCTHRILINLMIVCAAREDGRAGRDVVTDEFLRQLIRSRAVVTPAFVGAFLDHAMSCLAAEMQAPRAISPSQPMPSGVGRATAD